MSVVQETVKIEEVQKDDDTKDNKSKSFDVKVHLVLKMDLALALADFILQERCQNKALLALAHQIEGK